MIKKIEGDQKQYDSFHVDISSEWIRNEIRCDVYNSSNDTDATDVPIPNILHRQTVNI